MISDRFSAIFVPLGPGLKNIVILKKKAFKGMFSFPLAELNNYNNFALRFGIGERNEIYLISGYGKSQISSKENSCKRGEAFEKQISG